MVCNHQKDTQFKRNLARYKMNIIPLLSYRRLGSVKTTDKLFAVAENPFILTSVAFHLPAWVSDSMNYSRIITTVPEVGFVDRTLLLA